MALAKEWTDHKVKESKDDFAKYVLNSGQLLDRLTEMIDKRIQGILTSEENDDYLSPSWALQQANRLGQRKAYNEIKKLLNRG